MKPRKLLVLAKNNYELAKWLKEVGIPFHPDHTVRVTDIDRYLRGIRGDNYGIVQLQWDYLKSKRAGGDYLNLVLLQLRREGVRLFGSAQHEEIRIWYKGGNPEAAAFVRAWETVFGSPHGDSSPHVEACTLRDQDPPADLHDRHERDAADQPHRHTCTCCALPR
jgi:hypothetical protein